jgi:hypothetical protein
MRRGIWMRNRRILLWILIFNASLSSSNKEDKDHEDLEEQDPEQDVEEDQEQIWMRRIWMRIRIIL